MSAGLTSELQEFALFIQTKLHNGENQVSPEEVLDECREAHPSEEEFEENVQAIQEALDEMNAGARGKSVDQLRQEFDEFRRNRESIRQDQGSDFHSATASANPAR